MSLCMQNGVSQTQGWDTHKEFASMILKRLQALIKMGQIPKFDYSVPVLSKINSYSGGGGVLQGDRGAFVRPSKIGFGLWASTWGSAMACHLVVPRSKPSWLLWFPFCLHLFSVSWATFSHLHLAAFSFISPLQLAQMMDSFHLPAASSGQVPSLHGKQAVEWLQN